MTDDRESIYRTIRATYGRVAQQAGVSCCGTERNRADCCSPASAYDASLLAELPPDVTGLSLGCGDPVTIASLQPGETVLDLGSGGGLDCFLAARQVGETGRVIGVDMTPEMIARANANREALGLSSVEFRQGMIEALPVEDNSVDVIMSNCVINLSPDKPAVFREMFRVLRPGGRFAISDIVTEGEFAPALRSYLDLWAACISGAIDLNLYTMLLSEAGFVAVQVAEKANLYGPALHLPGVPRIFSARITGRKPTLDGSYKEQG